MLFNSLDFAIFLPVVFLLYWFVFNKNIRQQNIFLVVSSYTFYAWWDWRFLSLIILSTIIDYIIGTKLSGEENEKKRKFLLGISVFANLGILGFFKYFNFFIENFIYAFSVFGAEINSRGSLNIILPVGISFYTFQTLSYTIDVYRKKLEPTKDLTSFAAFVSFFPQLVAGPIERATNLLPQFTKIRSFNNENALKGFRQILWGLFKKVVIADSCAGFANQIFENSSGHNGSALLIGAFFFAFQIYGDFSGYSDIAIGVSRLFSFKLKPNFLYPYFSRDTAEFWRRWHISLSTWFRDYVYIPLGGSKVSLSKQIRNVFVVFIVSGFWHGASWNFVAWGLICALYFLPMLLTKKNRDNMKIVADDRSFPTFKEALGMLCTFSLALLAWIFFRAESLTQAFDIVAEILSSSLFQVPHFSQRKESLMIFFLIGLLLSIEWFGRREDNPLELVMKVKFKPFRWVAYYFLACLILLFIGQKQDFIYFQF